MAKKKTSDEDRGMPGSPSLFRGKIRMPVSTTFTPEHHNKINRNMRRLGLTRSDFLGLLVELYADKVQLP